MALRVWRSRRNCRPNSVDNDPESPVIQARPPALFRLVKSTEPWSDDDYTLDLERTLQAAGFASVRTVASDPRHRTVLARPSSPRGVPPANH